MNIEELAFYLYMEEQEKEKNENDQCGNEVISSIKQGTMFCDRGPAPLT